MAEAAMTQKEALYLSYNEDKNGPFDEAVEISNRVGCVTWLDGFSLNPERPRYPIDVFVRLTGQERYFRGILLAIASAKTLDANFLDGERNHRPSAWRERDQQQNSDFESVLFISRLQEVSKPREVENRAAPQHPVYVGL
jgi:hypothetical protein